VKIYEEHFDELVSATTNGPAAVAAKLRKLAEQIEASAVSSSLFVGRLECRDKEVRSTMELTIVEPIS
jgi:hypothetical protein